MAPLAVVVRNDDEAASLLDDGGGGGCPVLLAGVSRRRPPPPPSPPPPIHGKQAARNAVMRCIRSPLAAVLWMTSTCKRADDAISPSDNKQPISKNTVATGAAVAERRREAARRTSLEQLLRMEGAPPPPSPSPSRPDRKSKPAADTTAPSHKVSSTCAVAVKEKRKREPPLSPYNKIHSSTVAVVSGDERRHAAAAVPDAVKLDADGGGRRTNAERLVVVLASLRACSRSPGMPKGSNGKVAAAGKAELFYYRPIPMGRRCRVQHLEESPYNYK
ncbi:unnamed protein product [Urochloa decumbens]|uniref:Uncharacterized protein n=1 Tax=Urochloa decumbens TaxID=240449 RepID=A0ABC8ZP41_9POAL